MNIEIDTKKLAKTILGEMPDDGSVETQILIGKTQGVQIQLVICKDRGNFMDVPKKPNDICIEFKP